MIFQFTGNQPESLTSPGGSSSLSDCRTALPSSLQLWITGIAPARFGGLDEAGRNFDEFARQAP